VRLPGCEGGTIVITMARKTGPRAARSVTRDVEPSSMSDVLVHPPRATVAFVDRHEAAVVPARARHHAGTYRFGVRPDVALDEREVLLVLDDGQYWFELRGISVRGVARRVERANAGEADALAWYAIEPRRVLAWDYGTLREA
jgi:hypothetical protein